jgi:hypothetical protein
VTAYKLKQLGFDTWRMGFFFSSHPEWLWGHPVPFSMSTGESFSRDKMISI